MAQPPVLTHCYPSVPMFPAGLVAIEAAQHLPFLNPGSEDPSRGQRLTCRKDYVAKHMLATPSNSDFHLFVSVLTPKNNKQPLLKVVCGFMFLR